MWEDAVWNPMLSWISNGFRGLRLELFAERKIFLKENNKLGEFGEKACYNLNVHNGKFT